MPPLLKSVSKNKTDRSPSYEIEIGMLVRLVKCRYSRASFQKCLFSGEGNNCHFQGMAPPLLEYFFVALLSSTLYPCLLRPPL